MTNGVSISFLVVPKQTISRFCRQKIVHIFFVLSFCGMFFFFCLNSVWIKLNGNVKIAQLDACDILVRILHLADMHWFSSWPCLDNMLWMRSDCELALAALQPFVWLLVVLIVFFSLKFLHTLTNGIETYCHFDTKVRIQYAIATATTLTTTTDWNDLLTIISRRKKNKECFALCTLAAWLQMNFLINAHRVAQRGMYLSLLCECDKIRSANDSI